MPARAILSILIALALLTGCESGGKAFYLEGESQASAFFFEGKRLVEVRVDRSLVDGELESLFATPGASRGVCSDEVYALRSLCYDSLASVLGEEDAITAWRKNGKELSKSNFIENIASLCPDFDEKAFTKCLEDVEEHYVYNLTAVLSHVEKDEWASFIPIWLAAALS